MKRRGMQDRTAFPGPAHFNPSGPTHVNLIASDCFLWKFASMGPYGGMIMK